MSYIIRSDNVCDIHFDFYKDVRVWEAFFRGVQMNYSLIYPNGNIMKVNFKLNNMATIEQLDVKIETVKKQLYYICECKSISNKERNDLRQYYEEKLESYIARRNKLIKNIDVQAEILNPERK